MFRHLVHRSTYIGLSIVPEVTESSEVNGIVVVTIVNGLVNGTNWLKVVFRLQSFYKLAHIL